jgi:hypothetical protein
MDRKEFDIQIPDDQAETLLVQLFLTSKKLKNNTYTRILYCLRVLLFLKYIQLRIQSKDIYNVIPTSVTIQ